MRLVLFQPDIPHNLGAAVRIAACFDVPLEIIEPCGFPLTDKGIRRAALDYAEHATIHRHASWPAFQQSTARREGRLVLFSTAAATPLWDFAFAESDLLMFGRESAGVPPEVAATADAAVRIPLAPGVRSLNVAVAAGIGLSEARRQVALAGQAAGGSSQLS
jgi:tRNA (cytidine/uridine-2'-O-)-methyltransferase